MVILYVILSNLYPFDVESGLHDVEKTLEIFASMKKLAVARRCHDIVKEVVDTARKLHYDRSKPRQDDPDLPPPVSANDLVDSARGENLDLDMFTNDDLFASLVDGNVVSNFLDFEDWSAWSEPSWRG
jgi:hypothetical protein